VDSDELKFVYHRNGQDLIQVLPTFASLFTLGSLTEGLDLPGFKYDPSLLLHGQQYIEIYRPLPSKASVSSFYYVCIGTVLILGSVLSY